MMRWDIINHFIKKNGYKSYLEIGYYKGWSFDRVECDQKTAVDPNPSKFEYQEKAAYMDFMHVFKDKPSPSEVLFKMTSDDFFKNLTSSSKWDIIFIDGLHEAKQVIRDFKNSVRHLNEGGVMIFHDCNPPKYEHTTTGIDGCWTGDTYLAACCIQMAFGPRLFYTVDTDWGVGVLKPNKYDVNADWSEFEMIIPKNSKRFETFDSNRKELLNLISVEEFLEKEKEVVSTVQPGIQPEDYQWPHQLGDDFM